MILVAVWEMNLQLVKVEVGKLVEGHYCHIVRVGGGLTGGQQWMWRKVDESEVSVIVESA